MQDMYLKHLGLPESPFNVAPDPRFFYTNRSFQEAFLVLRYGIKLRKGAIILTGVSGIGKTSLIAMLKTRCESNTHIAEILNPAQDAPALLAHVMRALGVGKIPEDRDAILQELRRYLIKQREQGHTVVVILEDAQELDVNALKELASISELHSDDPSLLQIVLVGRPELKTKLEDPALESFSKYIAVRCQLAPLKMDEVGAYINHRLASAGHGRSDLFRRLAINKIAAYSKGIPGLINVICEQGLQSAYSTSQKSVSAETIDKVWQNLQLTGESEFEVARLLAEIRQNSQPAEEHLQGGDGLAKACAPTTRKKNDPPRPEAWNIGSEGKLERKPRPSSLGPVATSILLAALFLAGGVAVLFKGPSATSGSKYSDVAVTEQQTNSDANARVPEQMPEAQVVAKNPTSIEGASSVKPLMEPKSKQNAPIVYVHTSEERDRSVLEEIGNILRVDGYSVRDTRFTRARTQGDVRFFFPQDRPDAERIKSVVQSELGKRGNSLSLRLLQRDGKKFEHASPGKIEVWLPPLASADRRS